MPGYTYECERCGRIQEKFQPIFEPQEASCSLCGGRLKRLQAADAKLVSNIGGVLIPDYRDRQYIVHVKQEKVGAGKVVGRKEHQSTGRARRSI